MAAKLSKVEVIKLIGQFDPRASSENLLEYTQRIYELGVKRGKQDKKAKAACQVSDLGNE